MIWSETYLLEGLLIGRRVRKLRDASAAVRISEGIKNVSQRL